MSLIASCVIAEPPTFTDPVQTRPELSAFSAKPPIYQVIVIQLPSQSTPTFTVPVRSEDNGEDLIADFFLDYGSSRQSSLGGHFINPSTLSDPTERSISFPWQSAATTSGGCHTLTIVVAHQSSFMDLQTLDPKAAATDAAIITWWVNVVPTPSGDQTVVGCPTQQPAIVSP